MNEEYLVSASHQLALITSLPFVHTARRSYRLGRFSELSGPSGKFCELNFLEEGEVVTRLP